MKKNLLLLIVTIVFFSCEKDKTNPTVSTPGFTAGQGGIYISNEGGFQSGNSSISYYNPSDQTIKNDLFQNVNGQALGDICQSMNVINGKLYIVVNNSGKIEVCDPLTLKRTTTITGFTSPRYIVTVDVNKAYVSDLYSNSISIVNTANNMIQGSIQLTGSTEQMVVSDNKVYVTNSLSDYLFVIDAFTNIITDSILISKGANSIQEDVNGKLWILCGGDYVTTPAAIFRIEPVSKQIEFSQTFAVTDYLNRLCMNSGKDSLYFLFNNVYQMNVTDNTFPSAPFIAASGNSFYGLGINLASNEIYVADAGNFTQEGKVYRYNVSGNLIDDFTVGINPGGFYFLP